jgi:DNA-binding transcriptional LysR family regulator
MDWDDVRHFLTLARSGSVRAAGASLGVSHSTVARRVEALEARLGARLFDRTRDGYTLTPTGRQMLAGAERVEREMDDLARGVVGADERLVGTVALTCSDNFVAGLLLGDLAAFCRTYPGIGRARLEERRCARDHLRGDRRMSAPSKRSAQRGARLVAGRCDGHRERSIGRHRPPRRAQVDAPLEQTAGVTAATADHRAEMVDVR